MCKNKNIDMKYLTILIIVFHTLNAVNLVGQESDILNVTHEDLYSDFKNQLSIINGGHSSFLKTDNGEIIVRNISDSETKYFIIPDTVGIATVYLMRVEEGNSIVIYKKQFRVIELPLPIANIANQSGGKIDKNTLFLQTGIGASYNILKNIGWHTGLNKVTGYSIAIIRSDKMIFLQEVSGFRFTPEIKELREKTKKGDRILFFDIQAKNMSDLILALQPIEFLIW